MLPDILAGKKFIALAISEAFVGSDVRGMRTWAKKQADGSYVVNGQKKWITGGMVCLSRLLSTADLALTKFDVSLQTIS